MDLLPEAIVFQQERALNTNLQTKAAHHFFSLS
jgi:hypothetical protein